MSRVVVDMLPFALAGAFTPAWIVLTIGLLGTAHPARNASLFVGGVAAARLVAGSAALFLFEVPPIGPLPATGPGPVGSTVFAALALIAFALGWREFRKRHEEMPGFERWRERFSALRPATAFGLGILVFVLPGAQWVYLLAGVDAISAGGLAAERAFGALVAFVAVLHVLLVAPIALYSWMGERRSQGLREAASAWLTSHGHAVNAVLLAAVGVYFLARTATGLTPLLGG